MKYKYKDYDFSELDLDHEEIEEVIFNFNEGGIDFEVANYRFIAKDEIDDILKNELLSDDALGYFNSDFISDVTNIPIDLVQKAQVNDCYDILHHFMAEHIDDVVSEYVRLDGYGHHFSHYDGKEHEIGEYYAFRVD